MYIDDVSKIKKAKIVFAQNIWVSLKDNNGLCGLLINHIDGNKK